jgi:hypothetical protein
MAKEKTGPEGVRRAGGESEADVEAHRSRRWTETRATTPSDEPGAHPQEARRAAVEDDVEGHSFGQNVMLSRSAAQSRERDIQRQLKQHDLKGEARRPFQKDR